MSRMRPDSENTKCAITLDTPLEKRRGSKLHPKNVMRKYLTDAPRFGKYEVRQKSGHRARETQGLETAPEGKLEEHMSWKPQVWKI